MVTDMTFTAKLKRTSTIWNNWREAGRLSGELGGARFHRSGLDYTSEALTTDQIDALKAHTAIILEVSGHEGPLSLAEINEMDLRDDDGDDEPEETNGDTTTKPPYQRIQSARTAPRRR